MLMKASNLIILAHKFQSVNSQRGYNFIKMINKLN